MLFIIHIFNQTNLPKGCIGPEKTAPSCHRSHEALLCFSSNRGTLSPTAVTSFGSLDACLVTFIAMHAYIHAQFQHLIGNPLCCIDDLHTHRQIPCHLSWVLLCGHLFQIYGSGIHPKSLLAFIRAGALSVFTRACLILGALTAIPANQITLT